MLQRMRYFIIAIVIFRRFHCVASCRMLHFDIYTIFVFAFTFFAVAHLPERVAVNVFLLASLKRRNVFAAAT